MLSSPFEDAKLKFGLLLQKNTLKNSPKFNSQVKII